MTRDTTIVVRRLLSARREEIFAAWLDPDSLAQWMAPGETTSATAEVEPRVGGRFVIVMKHGDRAWEHRGEYLRIEPPSLLSFTWISDGTEQRPTVVTVELHERSGGTELVLTHRGLPPAQMDSHYQGWTDIVRKLDETLEAGEA